MPRLSWNLMLMLAGFGVLRTAKDSHNRFFGTLLLLTAVQGAALKEIDLSLGSWPIGYHVYILLHLVSIATSPLQLLWSISRLWAKAKRDTGSIPGKQLARATIEYGIKILHEGRDEYGYTSVDIVAIHGLGSNPEWAWRHEETGKEWPKEFLPKTCPKTRIMAFNHNSVWDFDAPIKSVEACGQQLLDALNSEKKRRIIFIGHSFGGIIIKKALVIASVVDEYEEIKNSSLGVIFLGVPHGGSRISPVGMLMSYTTYWIGSTTELLEVLQPGGDSLKELNHSFLISVRHPSIKIVNFYETKKSKVLGIPFWTAVDKYASTIPGTKNCALEADHIGMNKFGSDGGRYAAVANEINHMVKKVEDEYSLALDHEQREIITNLDWLGSEVRREAIGQRHKSTLQWVDEHGLTSSWLKGNSKVVWVSGKAGSGKSTLSKYILGCLEDSKFDPRKTSVLSFFFSDRGSDLNKSHQGMLQSLLAQLLEKIPLLSSHIPGKYKNTRGNDNHIVRKEIKWTINDLQTTLATMVECSKERMIFVIIDAIDECQDNPKIPVLQFLTSLMGLEPPRIFITTRTHPEINEYLERGPTIPLGDMNTSDIRGYFKSEMASLASIFVDYKPKDIEDLVELAIRRAEGVFLWASLTVRELGVRARRGGKMQELKHALNDVPDDLGGLYERMFERVMAGTESEGRRILQWSFFAERPLTLVEFCYAMAISTSAPDFRLIPSLQESSDILSTSQMEKRICNLGCGFLEVKGPAGSGGSRGPMEEETGNSGDKEVVQVIHQSAKEFLTEKIGALALKEIQRHMARVCITAVLHLPSLPSLPISDISFISYAVKNWPIHASKVDVDGQVQMEAFGWPKTQRYLVWWTAFRDLKPDDGSLWDHPLGVASEMGLQSDIRQFLEELSTTTMTATNRDNILTKALLHAVSGGQKKVLQLLIDKGVDVNLAHPDLGNALQIAARYGNKDVLCLLLNLGANLNAYGGVGLFGKSVLQIAVESEDNDVVQLLIDRGADVNVICTLGKNVFHECTLQEEFRSANIGDNTSMIHLLPENDADVSSSTDKVDNENYYFNDQLSSGLIHETDKPFKYPIDSGQYLRMLGSCQCALQAAALIALQHGNTDIIQLLIANGADLNIYTRGGGTILYAMARGGHISLIQLLIDNGADVNHVGGLFGSALNAAASCGNRCGVELLLKSGANVNSSGGPGGSALGDAIFTGDKQTIELLLASGANVNISGGFHGSALGVAISREEKQTIQLLLASGASVNIGGGIHGSVLGEAISARDKQTIQLLLARGANVNTSGGLYGSSLGVAISMGDKKTIQLLLTRGANANIGGGIHGSALGEAISARDKQTIQLLLARGANVNIGEGLHGGALGEAVFAGDQETIQLLTKDTTETIGQLLSRDADETMQLLLTTGADLDYIRWFNDNKLYVAARCGKNSTVEELITAGASVVLWNRYGDFCMKNPPAQACREGWMLRIWESLLGGGQPEPSLQYSHGYLFEGHKELAELLIDISSKGGYFVSPSGIVYNTGYNMGCVTPEICWTIDRPGLWCSLVDDDKYSPLGAKQKDLAGNDWSGPPDDGFSDYELSPDPEPDFTVQSQRIELFLWAFRNQLWDKIF